MVKRTDIQDGITLMLISRMKSTFYKNGGITMNEKFKELYNLVMTILMDAPEEDECTDEENEVYAECQNLKETLEELNERRRFL